MSYINQVSVSNSSGTELYEIHDQRLNAVAAVAVTGQYADLIGAPEVDETVTETGTNAVTGAAVAAYVDTMLGGVANGSY